MVKNAQKVSQEVPDICPNCADIGTVSIITKTIGGVSTDYFQCSSCRYRWPVDPYLKIEEKSS